MGYQCIKSIVIGFLLKRGITCDRNTDSNCHLLMSMGQNLFSMIVPHVNQLTAKYNFEILNCIY